MKAFYTILLLIVSNIFMTFAWYGHLKLQETKVISNWPLYAVVLFSWVIALAEYSCQVPANLPLLYVWYWRYILYFINDGLIAFAHYFIYFSIPFVKNV